MEQSHDIFQPPLQQRVCLASGLPGCTAQLYKYCTSKGLVKTPTSRRYERVESFFINNSDDVYKRAGCQKGICISTFSPLV